MTIRTTYLNDDLYQYIQLKSLREPEILQELRSETSKLSTSSMQVAPEQGQFMGILTRMLAAKKTIEVGVYTGYSALSVAMALPDDGCVVACDINEEWTTLAREYWQKAGQGNKIQLHLAPAEKTLNEMLQAGEAGQYDLAFIDADKANYDVYYELCLQLVRKGGLILIDNVLWDGEITNEANQKNNTLAIRALNDKLAIDDRVFISMVPIGDGLTIALKK